MVAVRVPLTRGLYATIDEEDLPLVTGRSWWALKTPNSHTYYAMAWFGDREKKGGRCRLMHSLILGAGPKQRIDHVNGDGLDNRRENIRFATHAQNIANSGLSKANRSGYKGVSRHGSKWAAFITKDYKGHYIGLFSDPKEAARAYDEKARELFGEYARLNFPDQDTLGEVK
jgi:hypothetical protein